jgi:DNA-binding CsgD family transcriptional regulator
MIRRPTSLSGPTVASAGGLRGTAKPAIRPERGRTARRSTSPRLAGAFSSLGRLILDGLDRGVILLDHSGRVLDANLPARGVLDGGDGLSLRNGRLKSSNADFEVRLHRLLDHVRAGAMHAAQPIAARFRRPRAQSYFVVVRPVPPDTNQRNVAASLFIFAIDGRREISTDLLRELYGLTRAQAAVARRLFAGRSVEQTAAGLRLSPNTVRTHLKQIFTKCEVQSQAELMHLLTQGPRSL